MSSRLISHVYVSFIHCSQDIINAVVAMNPRMVYELPCEWNAQLTTKTRCQCMAQPFVPHWNSPHKLNVKLPEALRLRTMHDAFEQLTGDTLTGPLVRQTCQRAPATMDEPLQPLAPDSPPSYVTAAAPKQQPRRFSFVNTDFPEQCSTEEQFQFVHYRQHPFFWASTDINAPIPPRGNNRSAEECNEYRARQIKYIGRRHVMPVLMNDTRFLTQVPVTLGITLCTQFSTDRLNTFMAVCKAWDGPVSAVFYASDYDHMDVRSSDSRYSLNGRLRLDL